VTERSTMAAAAAEQTLLAPPRADDGAPPLDDAFRSIRVPAAGGTVRKLLAFMGPGYLIAVGYMDPGNWATSLAGGARFGYELLFVALLSNVMAVVLQALAARLGIGAGRDLARACREAYPRPAAIALWLLAEAAICATDLAEVIGTAIGLQLLFGLPLAAGVLVTALDTFLVLALQRAGFRAIEVFVIALLAVIAVCFTVQIGLARPAWSQVAAGLLPHTGLVTDPARLYLALGIIGATVMPHNLYLHSALVQTRAFGDSLAEKRQALRYSEIDSVLALTFAFLINGAILILAAATFHAGPHQDIVELGQAHALLEPLLGGSIAPMLFAIALVCCGLNSTITATLSGQTVMEGFVNMRMAPWARRLITRGIAIVPAIIVTIVAGESATARLLILSQVMLSLQLPFAVVPLIAFTADRKGLGPLVAPRWLTALASAIAVLIIVLNGVLLWGTLTG
jgi:manganese transport protein